MADDRLLIDSDVFIDHLRGSRRLTEAGHRYSVISRCELFAGRDDAESDVRAVLTRHVEIEMTPEIAERAGRIRRSIQIGTPDAVIAATALTHDLVLVTRNVKHFARVPQLRLRTALDDPQ